MGTILLFCAPAKWEVTHCISLDWFRPSLQRAGVDQMQVIVFACCCQAQKESLIDAELPGASEEPRLVKIVELRNTRWLILGFHTRQEKRGSTLQRGQWEAKIQMCWQWSSHQGRGRLIAQSTEAHFAIIYELPGLSSLAHQAVVPWYYSITRRSSWRGSYTQTVIPSSPVEGEAMSPVQVLSDTI